MSACSGIIDASEDDDALFPLDAAGGFGSPDASGGAGPGFDAGSYDSGTWSPLPSAPGFDAWVPPNDMEATVPPDAWSASDATFVRDADTPDAAGPTGSNPESGRLAGITAAHNAVRARVMTSTPLPPLEWGADIAAVAQAYAEKLAASCGSLVHSSSQERNGWGENLAMVGGGSSTQQQAVNLWESETKCYTFGAFQPGVNATCTSQCASYGGCGHYTQIVWRKTRRIGCGVAQCGSGGGARSYWVCNYDPPGNYIGQLPY